MALMYLGVFVVFTRFKFAVSPSQIAVTLSTMMSGLQFPGLQCTGLSCLRQCWRLITSCNRSQNSSRV